MWSSSVTTRLSHVRSRARIGDPAQAEQDGALAPAKDRRTCSGRRPSGLGAGRRMDEPAAQRAGRDVCDDVELLTGVGERALDAASRTRSSRSAGTAPTLAQHRRKAGQQMVDRAAARGPRRRLVELLVQRAESLHRCHVLGDPAERALHGRRARRRCPRGACDARLRPRARATGTTRPLSTRPEDLALHVACRLAVPGRYEPRLLAQDSGVQLLELGARLDPELVDERACASRGTPAVLLPAGRYGRARACAARTPARAAALVAASVSSSPITSR